MGLTTLPSSILQQEIPRNNGLVKWKMFDNWRTWFPVSSTKTHAHSTISAASVMIHHYTAAYQVSCHHLPLWRQQEPAVYSWFWQLAPWWHSACAFPKMPWSLHGYPKRLQVDMGVPLGEKPESEGPLQPKNYLNKSFFFATVWKVWLLGSWQCLMREGQVQPRKIIQK